VSGEEEALDDMYKGSTTAREPYVDFLDPYVTDLLTTKFTRAELFREGQRRGVVCLPVNDVGEVVEDPHLNHRGFFLEIEHPVCGKLHYPRPPYLCPDMPWRMWRPSPRLGEHNEEIYCGELGFSRDELSMLRSAGVI
jgi:crotonobetainyl-CoA:carnitine CoA-transferase CaiB-like acyl-CoA transferase